MRQDQTFPSWPFVSLSPGHLIICGDVPRHVFCLEKLRDDWDKLGIHSVLEELRSEGGEAMVLENNYFIEEILPNAILRRLSDEEMREYRRPFAEPGEGRRPTLTWPRQIPVAGEPANVHAIATECADWLGTSNVPKLFLTVEPGAFLAIDTLVNLVRVASAHREDGGKDPFRSGRFAGRDRAGDCRLDVEVSIRPVRDGFGSCPYREIQLPYWGR
jgi:hypothetical protein